LFGRLPALPCRFDLRIVLLRFLQQDIDFLMRATGQVAIAIENALAYREIAE
jgi:GAF domain-containing protein